MFQCKQFTIHQDHCAMKVTEMACLFGSWVATQVLEAQHILDIGSGTGLLTLMIAQQNQKASILGVELDESAFLQSLENLKTATFNHSINIIQQDIRSLKSPAQFDTIVCNPPFFENQLTAQNVKKKTAWHSEDLPLHELLNSCTELLKPHGELFLLLPYSRFSELELKATKCCLYINYMVEISHSDKHTCKTMMCRLSKNPSDFVKERFFVKNGDSYSDNFRTLLNDYYLRF